MYVYYYAVYICFVRTNNVSILPQITTIVVFLVFLVLCIVGVSRVKEGLDLTDVVPKNTNEYRFLEAQSKYFGFYNFYAVTKVWVAGGGGGGGIHIPGPLFTGTHVMINPAATFNCLKSVT